MAAVELLYPELTQYTDRLDMETLWIRAGDLYVDPTYQRSVNMGRVRKIARAWDQHAAGTLIVNIRHDSRIVVIDGQHRLRAFLINHKQDELLPCTVLYGLTVADEALLFASINGRLRAQPTALQTFRARLAGNDPVAIDILRILTDAGLEVAWSGTGAEANNRIRAINALEEVYERGGPHALAFVLATINAAWKYSEKYSYSSEVIRGMFMFLTAYPEVNMANLIEKLAGTSPGALIRQAAMMHDVGISLNRPVSFALAVRNRYNANKRVNLLGDMRSMSAAFIAARWSK